MMSPTSPERRYTILTLVVLFLTVVVFYSATPRDLNRVKTHVPPQDTSSDHSTAKPAAATPTETSTIEKGSNDDDVESGGQDPTPADEIKTSKFHYLIPASGNNNRLCINLISSAANRYPVPVLVGWNATGLLDAATTHLAKLHVIQRYLDRLPEEDDDDLVLIVDGYDVIMQLPPDIMLKRYFKALEAENARNAERFGLTVDELYDKGFETTLFFGADKICWPVDWRSPRCWAVPSSPMDPKAFGDKTNNGDMNYLLPRWLNSGTLIGPAKHMRAYIAGTLYEILNNYDARYPYRESDQLYLSVVWGRQEYFRSKYFSENGKVVGGPKDRRLPRVWDRTEPVEFHVGIEYDSAMFQTKAGYERWNDWIKYNATGEAAGSPPAAAVDRDLKNEKDLFQPYNITMPDDVQTALETIYDSIEEAHPKMPTGQWIRTISLGTNFITRNVWALWHLTGDKRVLEGQFTKFWFYPYARSLLKAAVRELQADRRVSAEPIGGRYWEHKMAYPDAETLRDQLGGAWSDEDGGRWVNYQSMCKEWEGELFAGDKVWKNLKPGRYVM